MSFSELIGVEVERYLAHFPVMDESAPRGTYSQIFLFLFLPTSPLVVGHAANTAEMVR